MRVNGFTALALACLAALPGVASAAVPIGHPLNVAPTTTEGCEMTILPPLRPVVGVPPSCTLFGTDASGAWGSQVPKGRWVVTSAQVRTGPRVGPMVFTAVESMRSQAGGGFVPPAGAICCRSSVESQVFTPTPNSVFTVAVRMPVKNTVELVDNEPVEVVDYIGLTLLSLDSSMPVNQGPASAASTTTWFMPAMRAGRQMLMGPSVPQTAPLIRAVLEPDADGDGLGDETQDPDRGRGGAGSAGGAGGAGSAGDAGDAGSAGQGAPPSPAKLEIARARVQRERRLLDVVAPITGRASGAVQVRFQAAGRTTRFTERVDAERRVVRIRRKIPAAQARAGTGILTLSYPGNEATQPQEVRLRAASRKAGLVAGRPEIEGDRLIASGRISRRARGVVRLQVLFEPPGEGTRTLEFKARIRNGRYALDERLPADVVAGLAARRGVVHSYTLYTGDGGPGLRGEMRSYQVLGAR